MDADEQVVDGNAAGGLLAAIFPFEMTTVTVTCAGCGASGPLGELWVYASAMGTIIRCPGCEAVLLRLTEVRGEYWLDLRGTRTLRLPATSRLEVTTSREEESMDTIAVVRASLANAHWILEQAVEGLTPDQLHWPPPGTANTIAATYGHVIESEDAFVQGTLLSRPLLGESDWAGRTGISLPAPRRGSDWYAWSRRVRLDLPAAREYAAAVYAATDAYVAALAPEALARPPRVAVPGNQSLSWLLTNLLVLHAVLHAGEISVLRGVQGLHGPF